MKIWQVNYQFWLWQTKSMPTKVDILSILDCPILDKETSVNVGKLWQIQANLWNVLILNLEPIFQTQHYKWSWEGHLSRVVGVKIIISLWKYIFDLKQVALLYSFQYWLLPNSQYSKMNTDSRIQQPSASFSAANILRMAPGMPCINKYSLLKY